MISRREYAVGSAATRRWRALLDAAEPLFETL
jgi:hypothetical protein